MIHFLTYATHSEGKYEELINNKHGVKITTLGWGKPWKGFLDRYKSYLEYLKNLKDDEIVCFIDGFDSEILKGPQEIEKRFRKMGSKVLFSKANSKIDGILISTLFVFPACKHGVIANAGLSMGYVGYLKPLFKRILKERCNDDQVILNRLCEEFDYIDIDIEKHIFSNEEPGDTCIKSSPGQVLTFRKVINSQRHFTQFYSFHFIIILLILYVKFKMKIFLVLVALLILGFLSGFFNSKCIL